MESFTVELLSVTNGKLSTKNTKATINVIGNDDPYGIFEIMPAKSRAQEQNSSLQLTISRRGGSLGAVRVSFQTFVPTPPSVSYATPGVDFVPVIDSVDFIQGQTEAKINISIIGDEIPEADEIFMVNLTSVQLIGSFEFVGMLKFHLLNYSSLLLTLLTMNY